MLGGDAVVRQRVLPCAVFLLLLLLGVLYHWSDHCREGSVDCLEEESERVECEETYPNEGRRS